MKRLLFFSFFLYGCASIKYPGWEEVNVVSSVDNMPCIEKGVKEVCKYSSNECTDWFKKRATLVDANTTVMHSSTHRERSLGRYFYCKAGLTPYRAPKFNKDEYRSGSNTVTGQAFLRQKGGGVVTCAGSPVIMYPDNEYFSDIADYDGMLQLGQEETKFLKSGYCDAQGNFEFHKVPEGKWIIETIVFWEVPSVNNIGNYYYTANMPQGGQVKQHVVVLNGEINKFIISSQ